MLALRGSEVVGPMRRPSIDDEAVEPVREGLCRGCGGFEAIEGEVLCRNCLDRKRARVERSGSR